MSSTGTLVSQWVGTCLTVPDKGDPEFLPSAGLTINGRKRQIMLSSSMIR